MTLHEFLDWTYGAEGDDLLREMLDDGADPNAREGPLGETPLHVATRRRRRSAVKILVIHGADVDAKTTGGKTAYAHAIRRGFNEIVELLVFEGASTELNEVDRFAVAVVNGRADEARAILANHPTVVRTGNREEDRLLADVAGRHDVNVVKFLIDAGADVAASGLDDGTPLHQAAWFGQPPNARLLIEAGAELEVFDATHQSSPLGWAVHGSRCSGGADERQDAYVALAELLLEAGSRLHYPDDPDGDAYMRRLLLDASPRVRRVLERHGPR